ncbi:hypothetical protein [Mycobacteroides chelonae]|uniref:hypothetical protein n=1 Tax=Mycobacteroides chelonae TaxID=1774 RepID=UPI0008AA3995|nr:hypothetical protein [Mycobacteroides chelonae]MBF9326039.1 hypothetical protein [Mycobacteroides chelonae]MBF9420215.1 hypothetical protein [Mycobacteroides chelonae]MBF9438683.1 hypothetical protein [Mycobacteroides chelonae]MBV6359992.1 hypothetical protein [Mycobacteroides chelonae]MEC4834404.1 hypothetical protein [Mycobacteroides chelonae]
MSDIDWETVEIDDGFRAAHRGACGRCGEGIYPGDMIRQAIGGHYEHVKCDIEVDAEADAQPVEHVGECF